MIFFIFYLCAILPIFLFILSASPNPLFTPPTIILPSLIKGRAIPIASFNTGIPYNLPATWSAISKTFPPILAPF